MLESIPYIDMRLKSAERKGDALELVLEKGKQRIVPADERSVRVLYSHGEFSDDADKPCITELDAFSDWDYEEDGECLYLNLPKLRIVIDKETNSFSYYDEDGSLLLKEREKRSKELKEIPVYSLTEGEAEKEYIETADGRKEVIKDAGKIQTGTAYQTRLHFEFDKDEDLYGLGQHEEGYHSLRGNVIYNNQANRTIAIPFFVSTKGYGVFVNTCSPSIFNDGCEGSYFYTEADSEMDFFFINGGDMNGAVRGFRKISGKAAMLPKWVFGYIQSQERYESQKEILEVADEYRKRGIGLDCIVLDWISWPDGQWGQKTFDENRFPDPDEMTKKLHEENVHFMISIWPNMAESCENLKEFKEKKLLLSHMNSYNALDPEARKLYWKQANEGLFSHGVDAWWCDNSEPICPEWMENVRPENSKNYENYCRSVSNHIPAPYMNAFGLYHAMGIYEGQRETAPDKRVVNLTRSGYPGQQRYGTILWSGDISASWDTMRRQIAAGLNFCASGMPYWTIDIGAFFVHNGVQWYWMGDYDKGAEDPAYCELFVRWYQWGAFLPVFRGHGTDVRRELWNFDRKEAAFYEALVTANRRRYELMPYIYSLAGRVHTDDGLIIKPLVYDFTGDKNVRDIFDQYMFGDAMMVCPVTEAMYFGKNKKDSTTRSVYLPAGCDWYDMYTDEKYEGGRWIEADASLEKIPVFIKAGAVIPMTEAALSTAELKDEYVFHIYPGADGSFTMYEDAGDGYGYEKGEYSLTEYRWDDKKAELSENGKSFLGKSVVHSKR
ncbi:MAG: glycoside hydrolase family 31 protein [Lachnospiraceae bacterium]|nr:glycoside hydrolase family 31 protein [Lachnospiraceae bacterium]